MNFFEAMQELYKGEKIRQKTWRNDSFLVLVKKPMIVGKEEKTTMTIIDNEGNEFMAYINYLQNTSWELYKEE